MPIITIAHQYGSYGRTIGQAVAAKLNLDYIDREIIKGVAERLDIDEDIASDLDERTQNTIVRMLALIGESDLMAIAPPDPSYPISVDERQYNRAAREVIASAARTNRVVIAGHGANFALAGKGGILRIFVYAPKEIRVATIMEREKVDQAEAVRRINHHDHDQAHYIKHYYNKDWHDPLSYDLMINTAVLKPERACDLIVQATNSCELGVYQE